MAEPQGQNDPTQGVGPLTESVSSGTMTPAVGPTQAVASAVNTTSSGSTQQSTNNTTPNRKTHPTNKDEWLTSIFINAEWPLPMNVAESSKVKSASDPGDSFWQDCHISWALEFIRRRHEGLDDVTILDPLNCGILYQAGIDPSSIPDRNSQDYRNGYAHIAKQLHGHKICILTVNNGFKFYPGNAITTSEGVAESDIPQNQPGYKQGLGVGTHWSFIVVDRRDPENPTARYVDSQVVPTKRRNKWKITNIESNGEVAGKILRGFENVLELEKGKLEANTLKFVPHMHKHNASGSSDYGACGPYVYAFLDYILTNKTTLIDPGLQAAYNDESTRRTRATDFGFDSLAVRARFAEELLEERKKYEALHKDRAVANLTDGVLRSLMTVDDLINLVLSSGSSTESSISGNRRLARNPGGPGNNDDDSDDDPDGTFGDPPIEKVHLRDELDENAQGYEDFIGWEARYEAAHTALIQRQKQADAEKQQKDSKKTETQESNTTEFFLGRNQYRNVPLHDVRIWPAREDDANIKFPAKFKKVPDFTFVLPETLKRWVNNDPEIKAQIPSFKQGTNWEHRARALLHVKIYKTLLDQPDVQYNRLWHNDTVVFQPGNEELVALKKQCNEKGDLRPYWGVLREMHMRHYMGDAAVDDLVKILEEYKVKKSAAGDKRKRNPGRDDSDSSSEDSDESGPDNNGGKGKRVKHGRKDVDRGDTFAEGYLAEPGTSGGGGAGKHAALQESSSFKALTNRAIEFASMEGYHVVEWMHRVASQGFLSTRIPLSPWQWRLCLQRAFNGMFTEDNLDKETSANYRGNLNQDDALSFAQIIEELNFRTEGVPNLAGQIQWYPDYYLREHSVILAVAGNQNNSPPTGNGPAANPEPTPNPDSTPAAGLTNSSGSKENNGRRGPAPVKGNRGSALHSTSLTTPAPRQLVDYRTDDTRNVRRAMTRQMHNDTRFQSYTFKSERMEPNHISRRAMCFVVKAGGRFGSESDADLEDVWRDDSLVFTASQRKTKRLSARMIRKKMAKHYHPDEPLEEDEGPDEEDDTEDDTREDEPGQNAPEDDDTGRADDGSAPTATSNASGDADTVSTATAGPTDATHGSAPQAAGSASSNSGTKRKNDATDTDSGLPSKRAKQTEGMSN